MSHYTEHTIFITGSAKPSAEDAIKNVYQTFSLCLIIDTRTDRIVDLCCTAVMRQTEDFIRDLLVGVNVVTEINDAVGLIRRRFMALVQKTLIVALRDAQNRYLMAFPEKRLPRGDETSNRAQKPADIRND